MKFPIIEYSQSFETLKLIITFEVKKSGTIRNSIIKSEGYQNNYDFVHFIEVIFSKVKLKRMNNFIFEAVSIFYYLKISLVKAVKVAIEIITQDSIVFRL